MILMKSPILLFQCFTIVGVCRIPVNISFQLFLLMCSIKTNYWVKEYPNHSIRGIECLSRALDQEQGTFQLEVYYFMSRYIVNFETKYNVAVVSLGIKHNAWTLK